MYLKLLIRSVKTMKIKVQTDEQCVIHLIFIKFEQHVV